MAQFSFAIVFLFRSFSFGLIFSVFHFQSEYYILLLYCYTALWGWYIFSLIPLLFSFWKLITTWDLRSLTTTQVYSSCILFVLSALDSKPQPIGCFPALLGCGTARYYILQVCIVQYTLHRSSAISAIKLIIYCKFLAFFL